MTAAAKHRDEAHRLFAEGHSNSEIRRRLGIALGTLRKWRKAADTPAYRAPSRIPLAVREEAIRLLRRGMSDHETQTVVGLNRKTISKLRAELGLGAFKPQHRLDGRIAEAVAKLAELSKAGVGIVEAAATAKVALLTVQRYVASGHIPKFTDARPKRRALTPEQVAEIAAWLPAATSYRAIAIKLGVCHSTVRDAAAPMVEQMQADGILPNCPCGRPRFHARGCASHIRSPYKRTNEDPARIARRVEIVDAIMSGDSYTEIARQFGLRPKSVRGAYLRYLTPAQRALRTRLEHERPVSASAPAHAPVTKPFGDALYARIAAAVPRWMSEATRDDVISEIYLAVLEGTLDVDAVEANAKRFANAAVSTYESKFGPRSLDAAMFDDSDRSLIESIPDPSALAAFDYIFEGDAA